MRKLLLVLFLFTLTSNALAEDEKWALVIVYLNPSVMTEEFEGFNPTVFIYDLRKDCENLLLSWQKDEGGTITRDSENHMVLKIESPPNSPESHKVFTCSRAEKMLLNRHK